MKNLIPIISFLFLTMTLFAQSKISHKVFDGDGMVVQMNENVAIDMDEDGKVDFYINQAQDQLGITAVVFVGCFGGQYDFATGKNEFKIYNEGELIEVNDDNFFDYIEDDATAYDGTSGLATGIEDQEDFYIGVALMAAVGYSARNGWIRLQLDVASNTLTIKEWAYTDDYSWGQGGIPAGETGVVSSVADPLDIRDVVTSPNPTSDLVNIRYNFTLNEQLTLSAYTHLGQQIYTRELQGGNQDISINTQDWPDGKYMLSFNSESGVKTEQLIVIK